MPNQMIALQARNPQLPDPARQTAQYSNMMNMARQAEAAALQAQRTRQEMQYAQAAEARDVAKFGAEQPARVAGALGTGLVGILRDPSNETIMQAGQTFASVGMEQDKFGPILKQIQDIPDSNARKLFVMQFIAQSEPARAALKFVMPEVKSEKVGDATVFYDANPASPIMGQELFRFTVAPEPVKMTQNVVEGVLMNTNPVTGVSAEAITGDPTQGSVLPAREPTYTRTGVASPYAVGGGTGANIMQPPMAVPSRLPAQAVGIPVGGPRGAPAKGSVAAALQTNPGALKDGAFARSQPGYAGASGGFATFKTPEDGVRAQENLLRTAYVGKGFNTIDKIINRYAPQGPENSAASVNNYKKYVARKTGVDINAPITAAQIPVVARAMREFETGTTSGGRGAASAGAGAPQTVGERQRQKGFQKTLELFDYNPQTGEDSISPLIKASTSGGLEKIGSDIVGFFGEATPGRVALGQLSTLKDSMTFTRLREKLGAQISDADVRLVANTMGDIANPDIPANERLAKWQNVVLPILVRGAGMTPVKRATPTGGSQGKGKPSLDSFRRK